MNADTLAITLDRLKFYAKDAVITLTKCVCQTDSTLKVNGRSYKVEKLLGEGGFSFVYLIRDLSSGRVYALKKVLVTSGPEGVKEVMKEVDAYRRFKHPNIIKILDSAVVQDDGGDGMIVYLLLPFYSRGNLQDAMASSSNAWSDINLLKLFLGTCLAVQSMHRYKKKPDSAEYPPAQSSGVASASEVGSTVSDNGDGTIMPYAHRDIKPGNIMIADDGSAILMDFGSTIPARIEVNNRQEALTQQDIASEHSTMPYRAPELFDVKTGITLDEKVDIWSLGCTLFAVAYGHSPFEVDGSSIAMAVGSGRYRHPEGRSPQLMTLIDAMLVVDPTTRPDIETVIEMTQGALEALQSQGT